MKFTIEERAISVNAFWSYRGNRKYITAKGRDWREYIQWHLQSLINKGEITPFGSTRPLIMDLEFGFKRKQKCDWDNYIKPLQDTFEGFLFDNDNQFIGTNRVRRYYGTETDYITVHIYESDEDDGRTT